MRPPAVKCSTVFRYICDNLDENLDSPKCRAIRRHIDSCEDCTAYLDSLKKTIRLYRSSPSPRVPGNVHRKLYRELSLVMKRKSR